MTSADDLLESAWGVIANANGGNWEDESPEWQEAARRWRDNWHQYLGTRQPEQPELTEVQLDPGVVGRVSNLERAMVNLAVSVAGLQTIVLQGSAAADSRPTQWETAQQLEPEREVELLDGSKIKIKDVPLDSKTGMPEEEWAMVNCPCPTHNEKRQAAAAAAKGEGPATGMYL